MSYTPIPTSDTNLSVSEDIQHRPKKFHIFRNLLGHYLVVLLLIIFIVLVTLLFKGIIPRHEDATNCGNSSVEALSQGCVFDVMSFAWLPERCFDRELTAEFLAQQDWKWFLDPEGIEVVEYVNITTGIHDEVYVTEEYQMYHCTFMWRKMHRAAIAGRALDGYISDIHHTAHCEMQILDRRLRLNDTSTTMYIKYADCPEETKDLGRLGWYRIIREQRVYRNP